MNKQEFHIKYGLYRALLRLIDGESNDHMYINALSKKDYRFFNRMRELNYQQDELIKKYKQLRKKLGFSHWISVNGRDLNRILRGE